MELYVALRYLSDDENRIVLQPLSDEKYQSDYINASYVDVSIQQVHVTD